MLLLLRDFLRQKHTANLQEIAWHLKQSPELTRTLLEHWIRKGRVSPCEKPSGCGTRCQSCRPEYAQVYQWVVDAPCRPYPPSCPSPAGGEGTGGLRVCQK